MIISSITFIHNQQSSMNLKEKLQFMVKDISEFLTSWAKFPEIFIKIGVLTINCNLANLNQSRFYNIESLLNLHQSLLHTLESLLDLFQSLFHTKKSSVILIPWRFHTRISWVISVQSLNELTIALSHRIRFNYSMDISCHLIAANKATILETDTTVWVENVHSTPSRSSNDERWLAIQFVENSTRARENFSAAPRAADEKREHLGPSTAVNELAGRLKRLSSSVENVISRGTWCSKCSSSTRNKLVHSTLAKENKGEISK